MREMVDGGDDEDTAGRGRRGKSRQYLFRVLHAGKQTFTEDEIEARIGAIRFQGGMHDFDAARQLGKAGEELPDFDDACRVSLDEDVTAWRKARRVDRVVSPTGPHLEHCALRKEPRQKSEMTVQRLASFEMTPQIGDILADRRNSVARIEVEMRCRHSISSTMTRLIALRRPVERCGEPSSCRRTIIRPSHAFATSLRRASNPRWHPRRMRAAYAPPGRP